MDGWRLQSSQGSGRPRRGAPGGTRGDELRHRTTAAWERFVAGHDDVVGVSPSVLSSWHRSRDLYKVDPHLSSAPRAAGRVSCPTLSYESTFAHLGGIAAMIVERSGDCVATVTDGDGRILALWGAGAAMRKAGESSLAPSFTWSESAVGTNGMGTALSQGGPVSVRGPEHWCEALHEWDCMGVPIHDPLTHNPVAALNVSSWRHEVPVHPSALTEKTAALRKGLDERAARDAAEVVRAFVEADRHARGSLIAVDIAGNILAANETARALLGRLHDGLVSDLADRWSAERAALREIATRSVRRAGEEEQWVGTADLGFLVGGDDRIFDIAPVSSPDGVVGLLLLSSEHRCGEQVTVPADAAVGGSLDLPRRISAVRDGHVLLLSPDEIRYAEASRHDVWLVTDQGRVRAAIHGIDNLERELAPFGFMRVHRSYVVNLARIRQIGHHSKGVLTLSTHSQRQEDIPVSRRCVLSLRQQLGL